MLSSSVCSQLGHVAQNAKRCPFSCAFLGHALERGKCGAHARRIGIVCVEQNAVVRGRGPLRPVVVRLVSGYGLGTCRFGDAIVQSNGDGRHDVLAVVLALNVHLERSVRRPRRTDPRKDILSVNFSDEWSR